MYSLYEQATPYQPGAQSAGHTPLVGAHTALSLQWQTPAQFKPKVPGEHTTNRYQILDAYKFNM